MSRGSERTTSVLSSDSLTNRGQAAVSGSGLSDGGVREVLDVALGVASELDVDVVLERVVEAARELSGARYAALGVLDASRTELGRFITTGMDQETRQVIGAFPRGRGVLGELIENPVSLRLSDVGAHPHSYGFPSGHPQMKTFLGVSVFVGGRPFGNLYLTDKADGEQFDERDEENVELLAELAGVAIDHARRYSGLESHHSELRQTVETLEATIQIARALGGETDLQLILGLVAKRGRALVAARTLVIEYEHDGELVIAAGAGELPAGLVGQRVALQGAVAEPALRTGRTVRLEDDPNKARFERHGVGRHGVQAAAGLVVPLLFRGKAHGVLIALDRLKDGPSFSAEDQRLLEAFAASAATAIATAETVEAERRRQRLAAAEQERSRWARELHDETLQSLAAVRLGLASQLRHSDDRGGLIETVRESVELLDREIGTLRALITDLRPAALDDVGAEAAIEDLVNRTRDRGLEVDLSVALALAGGDQPDRLSSDVETALYRIIQEALNNAQQHGEARQAWVEVEDDARTVRVMIRDAGRGFDTTAKTTGFGVMGMHERAELAGGSLSVTSAPGEGTTIQATLPSHRRTGAQAA
jgi:two-component system, NarL family, sensor histidine kinase DevS